MTKNDWPLRALTLQPALDAALATMARLEQEVQDLSCGKNGWRVQRTRAELAEARLRAVADVVRFALDEVNLRRDIQPRLLSALRIVMVTADAEASSTKTDQDALRPAGRKLRRMRRNLRGRSVLVRIDGIRYPATVVTHIRDDQWMVEGEELPERYGRGWEWASCRRAVVRRDHMRLVRFERQEGR